MAEYTTNQLDLWQQHLNRMRRANRNIRRAQNKLFRSISTSNINDEVPKDTNDQ
jgi:hypothetical protein